MANSYFLADLILFLIIVIVQQKMFQAKTNTILFIFTLYLVQLNLTNLFYFSVLVMKKVKIVAN